MRFFRGRTCSPRALIQPAKSELAGAGNLTTSEDQQPAPSKPRPLLRVLANALLEQRIAAPLRSLLVEQRSVRLRDNGARAELGKALGVQRCDRFLALLGPQPFFETNPTVKVTLMPRKLQSADDDDAVDRPIFAVVAGLLRSFPGDAALTAQDTSTCVLRIDGVVYVDRNQVLKEWLDADDVAPSPVVVGIPAFAE